MARQKSGQSLESQMEKVSALERKLAKEKEKVRRMQEIDNIRLGKLVKKIFKGMLPDDKEAQEDFLKSLVKSEDLGENIGVGDGESTVDDVDDSVRRYGVISAPDEDVAEDTTL